MKNNDFYIYNFRQGRFFIKNGLIPIDCGVGKKGDPFIVFERNDELNDVFEKWVKSVDNDKLNKK